MKEQYELIVINDTENYVLKTYRLGLLHKDFCGYNASITDSDGLTFEILKFNSKQGYEAYAQLMDSIAINGGNN